MDVCALVLKHAFSIPLGNYCLVGRWLRHMPEGTFIHASIAAAPQKRFECAVGWIAHYVTGAVYALALVAFVSGSWLARPTLMPAILFGIGSVLVPYLIMQLDPHDPIPIYGTPLTLGLITVKLKEHGMLGRVTQHEIHDGQRTSLGPFEVEPLAVNHSIPDAVGLVIRTAIGTVFHTGDFKFDPTPVEGKTTDNQRLRDLGDEGVLVLGSGNLVHNLHTYAWGREGVAPYDWAERFEARARQLLLEGDDAPLVHYERLGRDALLSVPTPDHYLPLLYALALRRPGEPVGFPVEGMDGGSVSMLAVQFGA